MNQSAIKVTPIQGNLSSSSRADDSYTLCWIKKGVEYIELDQAKYRNVSNSVFFLSPDFAWKISKNGTSGASGYVLYLPKYILDHPTFKNLHITQVRVFRSTDEIPKIKLAPGIEKRVQSILEMLDELVSTNLNHKDEAILSLLNTFFVYCDGKCNIKTSISENNAKATLVYKFKTVLNQRFAEYHAVNHYARYLHVSDKYLNECVKEILGTNAKSLINEQLLMAARHELKFTDKTIKEIAYGLGFSSPDYFSYFLKNHTGTTPSKLRKS
ncbi:MAG TPA: helix-turn-helix domain-containing protein [Cryomorphaceae bacterium]|nr:helix-turn-helix domain-containing protein [Cryomorphaceae bacterium]